MRTRHVLRALSLLAAVSVIGTISSNFIIQPAADVEPLYRVDAGGPGVVDEQFWEGDTGATPSPYVASDSRVITTTPDVDLSHSSVPADTPQSIFKTERYGRSDTGRTDLNWQFPVPEGNYEVRLFFAETFSEAQAVGARVFDVVIENRILSDNLDVFEQVGGYQALVKRYVVASDSALNIDLMLVAGAPEVKGIEISPAPADATPTPPEAEGPAPAPDPEPIPDATPVPDPQPSPDPQPAPEPAPQPSPDPQPTPAPDPQPSPDPQPNDGTGCKGKFVNSVADLMAVNGASNTTFCIAPGNYEIGTKVLEPGANVSLIGAPVTMRPDGYGHDFAVDAPSKIHGSGPAIIDLHDKYSITIKNLDLSGASGSCGNGMLGTIVTNGVDMKISYSRLHNGFNQAIGHSSGGVFDHVELDHNGAACLGGHNTGGIKTGSSDGYTITNSFVHDNLGPGIWCDASCDNFNVLGNVSARNSGQGVRFEHGAHVPACSSCQAVIKNNVLQDNGNCTCDRDLTNAGVGINSAENAEIIGNIFGGNFNGNGVYIQNGRHPVTNITISGNTMNGDVIKGADKANQITITGNR
ncbi:MAG TPA: malectin domain-containing carbohydrate-binding protein [Actinomycetota bacterium]|nr:malectin domain-containing carbohydrate-binding protein [Actinomycetota bacterium]